MKFAVMWNKNHFIPNMHTIDTYYIFCNMKILCILHGNFAQKKIVVLQNNAWTNNRKILILSSCSWYFFIVIEKFGYSDKALPLETDDDVPDTINSFLKSF